MPIPSYHSLQFGRYIVVSSIVSLALFLASVCLFLHRQCKISGYSSAIWASRNSLCGMVELTRSVPGFGQSSGSSEIQHLQCQYFHSTSLCHTHCSAEDPGWYCLFGHYKHTRTNNFWFSWMQPLALRLLVHLALPHNVCCNHLHIYFWIFFWKSSWDLQFRRLIDTVLRTIRRVLHLR